MSHPSILLVSTIDPSIMLCVIVVTALSQNMSTALSSLYIIFISRSWYAHHRNFPPVVHTILSVSHREQLGERRSENILSHILRFFYSSARAALRIVIRILYVNVRIRLLRARFLHGWSRRMSAPFTKNAPRRRNF